MTDREQLEELRLALNVAANALRRDEYRLQILRGNRGYISTWGDDKTWHIVAVPERERSARAWTAIKKRLAFCELTQDGDDEGCFRLHRLPSPEEAAEIRLVVGLSQTRPPPVKGFVAQQ